MLLTACATTSVTPEQISSIKTKENSAIITSYHKYDGFYSLTLKVLNLDTYKAHSLSMHGGENWVNAGPDIAIVESGKYRILDASLYGGNASGNVPMIMFWFEDFEVGTGEIVDIGALTIEKVTLETRAEGMDVVWNKALTLGLGDSNNRTTYMAYTLDHTDDARVQNMIETKYPELVGFPIRKLNVGKRISKDQFVNIIKEANQPDENGKLPNKAEGEAAVGAKLKALALEGSF